jgi:hypothetical protein
MSAEIFEEAFNLLISTEFSVRTIRDAFKHYGICDVDERVKNTQTHVAVYVKLHWGYRLISTDDSLKHDQCFTSNTYPQIYASLNIYSTRNNTDIWRETIKGTYVTRCSVRLTYYIL